MLQLVSPQRRPSHVHALIEVTLPSSFQPAVAVVRLHWASLPGGTLLRQVVHGLLDHLVHLAPDAVDFVLPVQVPPHDLVSLDEPVQLSLQLPVLALQQVGVLVQTVQLSLQVLVPVEHRVVGVPHALQVLLQLIHLQVVFPQTLLQVALVDAQVLPSQLLLLLLPQQFLLVLQSTVVLPLSFVNVNVQSVD